jgi:hypothetical protein
LSDQSWIFSHDCCEDVCPHNICLDYYILDNGDPYSRLSNDVDQDVQLILFGIPVLVLLPMVIDYFNGCTRTRNLGWHCDSNKNHGRTFVGIFSSMVWYLSSAASKKIQDGVMEEERI